MCVYLQFRLEKYTFCLEYLPFVWLHHCYDLHRLFMRNMNIHHKCTSAFLSLLLALSVDFHCFWIVCVYKISISNNITPLNLMYSIFLISPPSCDLRFFLYRSPFNRKLIWMNCFVSRFMIYIEQ